MNLMPNWKEGEKVRVVSRPVTDDDRKQNRYFEHMAGLTGVIQSVYGVDEVAVKIDPESMSKVSAQVHKESIERMRATFLKNVGEEGRKELTQEEINFNANYVLLVKGSDLEKTG